MSRQREYITRLLGRWSFWLVVEAEPKVFNLAVLYRILKRQRVVFFGTLVVFVLMGIAVSRIVTPMFRSITEVLVEGRTANDSGPSTVDPIQQITLPNQDDQIQTQIEVLQSNKILLSAFTAAGVPIPKSEDEAEDAHLPIVRVDQLSGTNALRISVDATDPELAAKLAGSIPDVYLRYLRDNRQSEVQNALTYLTNRLDGYNTALLAAERKLEAFKKSRKLQALNDEGPMRSNKVQVTDAEQAKAQADMAAAGKRLESLKIARKRLPKLKKRPGLEPNFQAIQAQMNVIAHLESQKEALLQTYLPNSPKVIEIQNQINSEKSYLKQIPRTSDSSSTSVDPEAQMLDDKIADAEANLASATAAYDRFTASKNRAEGALNEFNAVEPKQNELERDVESKKTQVAEATKQVAELQLRRNAVREPLTTLRPPTAPIQVKPQTGQYVFLSLLLGLLIAGTISVSREGLQDRLASRDEAFAITGLPILGETRAVFSGGKELAKSSIDDRTLDGFRLIGFRLAEAAADQDIKSVLVTATGPLDGKVQFCVNLALAAANDGLKVILVDANLQSPGLQRWFTNTSGVGIADILLKRSTLLESLVASPQENLQILFAGNVSNSASSLFSLATLPSLVSQLESQADIVLVNGPYGESNMATQVLARCVSSVIFVARIGKTSRGVLRRSVDEVQRQANNVLGVAIIDG